MGKLLQLPVIRRHVILLKLQTPGQLKPSLWLRTFYTLQTTDTGGIAESRESELLEIVAASCMPGWKLVWRPHPYERSNVNAYARVSAVADRLGFEQDCEIALFEQLEHSGIVITMFSSVLSDIIMSGKVPYVFAGLPCEETPGWNGIGNELKFSSSDELRQMLEVDTYRSLAREHFSGLYKLFCYSRSG